MRVLQLTRDYPPQSKGGISTAVAGLARALSAHGVPCAVISFDNWRPRTRAGAAPEPTPTERDGVSLLRVETPCQLDHAERFAADFGPTHLHVHHEMLWAFAMKLRQRRPAHSLLTVHVLQSELNRLRGVEVSTLSSAAQQTALQQADRVLAPSPAVQRLLLRRDASLAQRVEVVGLGIDDDPRAQRSVANRAADTAPRPGPTQRVLYVGRFADVNGTAQLFELVELLAPRLPQVRFTVSGGVPGNPRAERRWLRRWQREASPKAADQTEFVGWVDPDALAALYSASDALVSPSWFETFGLSVLEAMLYGLPVAASRSGGVEQLLRHGETGLLSAPRDTNALADNLSLLLTEPAQRQQLGAAAAAEVRARWLWPAIVPGLIAAYETAGRRS